MVLVGVCMVFGCVLNVQAVVQAKHSHTCVYRACDSERAVQISICVNGVHVCVWGERG